MIGGTTLDDRKEFSPYDTRVEEDELLENAEHIESVSSNGLPAVTNVSVTLSERHKILKILHFFKMFLSLNTAIENLTSLKSIVKFVIGCVVKSRALCLVPSTS